MILRLVIGSALVACACSGLSLPSHDAGTTVKADAGQGGGSNGGGTGGGGGGHPGSTFDAGWPVTELASDAFTETDLPGLKVHDEDALLSTNGRLFFAGSSNRFLEASNGNWHDVFSAEQSFTPVALRAVPEGVLILNSYTNQLLCDATCLAGGTPRNVDVDFAVFLKWACRGPGPLTVRSNRGDFYELRDGGWPLVSDAFVGASQGPCFRMDESKIYVTDDDRIGHLSIGSDVQFETPKDLDVPVADLVQTSFGLVAIASEPNELLVFTNSQWQSVGSPGGEPWVGGFALGDGRLLIVGLDALVVVSQGSLHRWPYPRGKMYSPGRNAVTMAADGTVWMVATFTDQLGDPLELVTGYRAKP